MAHFFGRPGTPGPSRHPGAVFIRPGHHVAHNTRLWPITPVFGRFHPSWPFGGLWRTFLGEPARPGRLGIPEPFSSVLAIMWPITHVFGRFHPSWPFGGLWRTFLGDPARPGRLGIPEPFSSVLAIMWPITHVFGL